MRIQANQAMAARRITLSLKEQSDILRTLNVGDGISYSMCPDLEAEDEIISLHGVVKDVRSREGNWVAVSVRFVELGLALVVLPEVGVPYGICEIARTTIAAATREDLNRDPQPKKEQREVELLQARQHTSDLVPDARKRSHTELRVRKQQRRGHTRGHKRRGSQRLAAQHDPHFPASGAVAPPTSDGVFDKRQSGQAIGGDPVHNTSRKSESLPTQGNTEEHGANLPEETAVQALLDQSRRGDSGGLPGKPTEDGSGKPARSGSSDKTSSEEACHRGHGVPGGIEADPNPVADDITDGRYATVDHSGYRVASMPGDNGC